MKGCNAVIARPLIPLLRVRYFRHCEETICKKPHKVRRFLQIGDQAISGHCCNIEPLMTKLNFLIFETEQLSLVIKVSNKLRVDGDCFVMH